MSKVIAEEAKYECNTDAPEYINGLIEKLIGNIQITPSFTKYHIDQ